VATRFARIGFSLVKSIISGRTRFALR